MLSFAHSKQLLAELGLTDDECEDLANVEYEVLSTKDDTITGFLVDFTPIASPPIAKQLMAKYGQLQVTVPPHFFDNVLSPL